MLRLSVFAFLLSSGSSMAVDLTTTTLDNPTAYIPPQCYTKTLDDAGVAHNPCQTCHVSARRPNFVNDPVLQQSYAMPGPALVNPWTNLFVDRTGVVAATDPAEIKAYVEQDNYLGTDGQPILAAKLAEVPVDWDSNGDGQWAGYVPDSYFAFDEEGFDHAPDGRLSGWRAFAYQPLPGGFWPTNGSGDDVLIRLPQAYRQDASGAVDLEVYKTNLSITEALIRRADVAIEPTDETAMGVDLDRDGVMGRATEVVFSFAPLDGEMMYWAGLAGTLSGAEAPLAAGLYPYGTEFLHSVRYLDPQGDTVAMAPRMKELRYMRKSRWQTYADLEDSALGEKKEDSDFPDRTKQFFGSSEAGIPTGNGWRLQGFIEDAAGDLRPQSFEETVFCTGCHGGVGTVDDSTFAFPRKLAAGSLRDGWYHWSQKSLSGTPDLIRADGMGDYVHYLRTNGAGDEYRANSEVIEAWLDGNRKLSDAKAAQIHDDIAPLIIPSQGRAMALNAAYRDIVHGQSFAKGRDAHVTPMDKTVWRKVEDEQPTGIETPEPAWFARR